MVHGEVRFPWEKPKENEEQEGGFMRRSRTSLAELTLLESELKRLRNLTFQKKHKTRIGGGGVTQAVVDVIHERWKTSEIVRLKIEGLPALNMKRIHEILEVCFFLIKLNLLLYAYKIWADSVLFMQYSSISKSSSSCSSNI